MLLQQVQGVETSKPLDGVLRPPIRRANESVSERQPATLTASTSFEEATSFISEATLDGNHMLEALGPEFQASSTEASNTTVKLQESAPSLEELPSNDRVPTKRSNRNSTSHQTQRKRHIAGDSDTSGSGLQFTANPTFHNLSCRQRR